jgi:hypothetical protein
MVAIPNDPENLTGYLRARLCYQSREACVKINLVLQHFTTAFGENFPLVKISRYIRYKVSATYLLPPGDVLLNNAIMLAECSYSSYMPRSYTSRQIPAHSSYVLTHI